MEHRAIGSLRVSVVGLGCNNFGMRIDDAATGRVVSADEFTTALIEEIRKLGLPAQRA